MKFDKSKSILLTTGLLNDYSKKSFNPYKQQSEKYMKFKKSSSQPSYFVSKSPIKKLSDIYRSISQQKMSKTNSFNKSKNLYNTITPQKRNSLQNNFTFKKNTGTINLRLDKGLQSNEKTKRLTLNKSGNDNKNIQSQFFNEITMIFIKITDQLHNFLDIKIQKQFQVNYSRFLQNIVQKQLNIKRQYQESIKIAINKISYLFKKCQQRKFKTKQNQLNQKFQKQLIPIKSDLKKKVLKNQLLIKQINRLQDRNSKLFQQINKIKSEYKQLKLKNLNNKSQSFQITDIYSCSVIKNKVKLSQHVFPLSSNNRQEHSSSQTQIIYRNNQQKIIQDFYQNQTNWGSKNQQNSKDDKLQLIKKIRKLQKKQKQFIKTLQLLQSDGVDVQRAFQQAINPQNLQNTQFQNEIDFKKLTRVPKHIKDMKNKDSYEASSSIVDTIQELTVNDLDCSALQEHIFYPIKQQYKSKPLPSQLKNKLKLDFDILYQEQEYYQQQQIDQDQQQYPNPAG